MRVFFSIINNPQEQRELDQNLDVLEFTATFHRFARLETNRVSYPSLLLHFNNINQTSLLLTSQ